MFSLSPTFLLFLFFPAVIHFVWTINGVTPAASFSANVHQTLLIELVSSSQQRKRTSKGSKDRVARQPHQKGGGNRKCERLTEHQKYGKLEKVGGRNQLFMAASPREAGRYFPTLMPKNKAEEDTNTNNNNVMMMTLLDFPLQMDDDEKLIVPNGAPPFAPLSRPVVEECDEGCREIERKLNEAIGKDREADKGGGAGGLIRMDDDHLMEEDGGMMEEGAGGTAPSWEETGTAAGGGVRRVTGRGGCYLEKFVPIGNCTKHGFEESMGDEKLCTACQGIYVMNRECFPVFVNSVVCDRREFECIYDRLSGSAQGKCRPKVLSFKVMHNRGTTECEQWAYEYIQVPVACECYLSKRSVWLEAVPPPIGEEHLR